jgi:hypothetical protein
VIIAVAVYSILIIGLGLWISMYYAKASQSVLSILDKREQPFVLFVYLIASPIAWAFYAWEPVGIANMFQQLTSNGIIGAGKSNESLSEFLARESLVFNRRRYLLFVAIVTIATAAIWVVGVTSSRNTFKFGFSQFWWSANPIYFWAVWLPLAFVILYMLLWIVIRRALAVRAINRVFDAFLIEPKLFHPDRANGFGPIGQYTAQISLLVVVAGIWVFLTIAYPMFFGQPANVKSDVLLYLLIYAIGVPIALVWPAWESHGVMKKARSQALESLAGQIRALLSTMAAEDLRMEVRPSRTDVPGARQRSSCLRALIGSASRRRPHNVHDEELPLQLERVKGKVELLQALVQQYKLIEREYRTWPFGTAVLSRYWLATIIPLILSITSIAVEIYF